MPENESKHSSGKIIAIAVVAGLGTAFVCRLVANLYFPDMSPAMTGGVVGGVTGAIIAGSLSKSRKA